MRIKISTEIVVGWLTWAIVSGINLYLLSVYDDVNALQLATLSLLLVLYFVFWNLQIFFCDDHHRVLDGALIAGQILIVCVIFFLSPHQFSSILMGITCSALAFHVSKQKGMLLVFLASLPLYFIYKFYWQFDGAFLTALLFATFNFFAFNMMYTLRMEQEARQQAEDANMRLVSTQSLLQQAVQQSERVRIARNIHDLLGHHLTALTIHLQVASRQTEGDTQKSIEQCHQLAKLLLSDVREAVSDIRDKSSIDLQQTVTKIMEGLPQLNIQFETTGKVVLQDMDIADALVKAIQESITNTMRHAKGNRVSIEFSRDDNHFILTIKNDGQLPDNIQLGNGLKGIRERITKLSGQADFSVLDGLFCTFIKVPVERYD